MQRFMAELSNPVNQADFERSWHSDPALNGDPKVEFVFAGQRVSAVVHTDPTAQWPSAGFRLSFSAAIRRLDRVCNIRWL